MLHAIFAIRHLQAQRTTLNLTVVHVRAVMEERIRNAQDAKIVLVVTML